MQTAYLKIVDGRARFADQSQFRAFLFGVIRRTANEERRRRLVRRTVSLGLATDHVTDGDALTPIVRAETSARLIEALRQLPPRQREVLHLVFYGELTVNEAAIAMGVSVGSARVHYDRGITRHGGAVARIVYLEATVGGGPQYVLVFLTKEGLLTDLDQVAR